MLQADPKYNNLLVSKFINKAMRKGKKVLAQKIVYRALDYIEKETKKNPLEVFNQAVTESSPRMETKPKRVGGATYQVPMEVNEKRQVALAMSWILEAAKKKKGESMEKKLAQELILAAHGEGGAVKKRVDVEKMAEANKAFAHLAR